jgi:(4-O-methyl)-D-glucuronate---lignin esterase
MVRIAVVLTLAALSAGAQPNHANYDEARVPKYSLPDPLLLANGRRVSTPGAWSDQRRPELLQLFRREMYGRSPGKPAHMSFELAAIDQHALGGLAERKEVMVYFAGRKDGPRMRLLLYLPAAAHGPVPVFLGLNFGGNQTVVSDPGIRLAQVWPRGGASGVIAKHAATEKSRGSAAARWQVEKILQQGYGLATAYYGDIEPDFNGGIQYGVRPLFFKAGKAAPAADGWGAIGAWAWGLSRALDYLETDKQVDARRVAVMGHSRLGKTALWAGAEDTRFAMVISNCSGEGGAALSRRMFGEQPKDLNTRFPYWFDANYRKYSDHETNLPFDQHELIALIAPRPVYIATAAEDLWADPKGQFLAAVAAGPVYELLGKQGLGTSEMPGLNQPIMRDIGYHNRTGKHDVTEYDWEQYLKFADMHFRNKH